MHCHACVAYIYKLYFGFIEVWILRPNLFLCGVAISLRYRYNPDIHITLTSIHGHSVTTAKQAIHLHTIGCAKQEMAFQKLNSTLNSLQEVQLIRQYQLILLPMFVPPYCLRIELIPVEIRCIPIAKSVAHCIKCCTFRFAHPDHTTSIVHSTFINP